MTYCPDENTKLDAEIVAQETPGLVVRCSADIKPKKIKWLWQERLPLGKCTLVAGEGGLGKSMLLAHLAATISRAALWPCGEGRAPIGSVIILSAEDDAADTIVPRLLAADADCSKVHIVEAVRKGDGTSRSFCLQDDLVRLESEIARVGDVLLVIIDPITSYLGRVDSHKNAELRSVLEPLGKMAARCGVSVVCNTHLSKAQGGSANSRVIGSVAFVNHARAAFIVTQDTEQPGRRLFLPSKANLGKPRDGLAYCIASTVIPIGDGEWTDAPFVKFEPDPVTITADQAVAAAEGNADQRSATEEAREFLREVLADGPMLAKEIKVQANDAMISFRTLNRIKQGLGVESYRETIPGPWFWRLPKDANPTQGNHVPDVGIVGTVVENQGFQGSKDAKDAKAQDGHLSADDFEERAAILEYDGGLDRAEAEAQAVAEFPELPPFLDRRKAS